MMVAHNQSQQNETSGNGMRVARKGNGTGAAYVVLAALAALAGGGASTLSEMGIMPATAGWHAVVQAHPVLMLLYVVVPALLGGFGSLWLPRAVQRSGVLLPRMNDAGFLCVFAGAALTVTGAELKTATLLWCAGTLMTSMALLVTVFDSRADMEERKPFSPFVWGEMLAAAVMLLTVPVMAGQIVKHWHDAAAVNVESFAGPVGWWCCLPVLVWCLKLALALASSLKNLLHSLWLLLLRLALWRGPKAFLCRALKVQALCRLAAPCWLCAPLQLPVWQCCGWLVHGMPVPRCVCRCSGAWLYGGGFRRLACATGAGKWPAFCTSAWRTVCCVRWFLSVAR